MCRVVLSSAGEKGVRRRVAFHRISFSFPGRLADSETRLVSTILTVAVWFPNPTRWQCLGVHPFAGLLLLGCLLWDVLPDLRLRTLLLATGNRETHELLVK